MDFRDIWNAVYANVMNKPRPWLAVDMREKASRIIMLVGPNCKA